MGNTMFNKDISHQFNGKTLNLPSLKCEDFMYTYTRLPSINFQNVVLKITLFVKIHTSKP